MQDFIKDVQCKISETNRNEIQFYFTGINRPDLNNMSFEISSFTNPFSAATIENIELKVFSSKDCSGSQEQTLKIAQLDIQPALIAPQNVTLQSSSTVLGATDLVLDFTVNTNEPVTKAGSGKIQILSPKWYNVGFKNNMMFDETI